MSVRTVGGNLLFWKIAVVFTSLLLFLGIGYVWIASHISKTYIHEVHQQLYGDIATHVASSTHPFKNDKPDTLVTHDIIHSIMVVNPSIEVYLLDSAGNIIDFVVPKSSVKKRTISLDLLKKYIETKGKEPIIGDNPKQPEESSIFSAAPIVENDKLRGYVYLVLASEKEQKILSNSDRQLFIKLGAPLFLATLCIVFLVGIVTFFLITDSVCDIAAVVEKFKEGDYQARITGQVKGNLGMLASTFNEMADVIVSNIKKITATDLLRQELIANVSHDLRTPLAIMQGYIETIIIKKDLISAEQRNKYMEIVWDSSQKLSKLIEQLFQYSKLEANQIEPEKESFFLNELVSDIYMKYQLLATEKHITLKLDVPANLPLVFADIGLTERVIQNLLDNALKFTPEGGRVTIQLQKKSTGVEVQIADTGQGIEEADQPFIFERYKQVNERTISTKKGMGLGLAIVKKILDLHQVAIYVRSTPSLGTVFWFELPRLTSPATLYS